MAKGPKSTAKQPASATKRAESAKIRGSEGARRLGLTLQAIGQWASRPGAPAERVGTALWLYWPSFPRWREQELQRQAVEEATAKLHKQIAELANPDGLKASVRIENADATMKELDVAERLATTVQIDLAAEITEKFCIDLRSQLLAFPRTWAPSLVGVTMVREMEIRLERGMHRILQSVSGVDGDTITELAA